MLNIVPTAAKPSSWLTRGGRALLTAVLPTRNRPAHCASQLRFLRANGFDHPIIVLDASDADAAAKVRDACASVAEYRHFDKSYRLVDKLDETVPGVRTPFVILIPDDDIILPSSIAAALSHLTRHPDYAAAHGYFLDFGIEKDDFDIFNVNDFTPSITDEDPLTRLYHLICRYQSFYWGVFRTEIFATAVKSARAMDVVLFRELTVMSTSILQGKVARLPMIHALRGAAPSHAALHDSHPLFWFLRDAESFMRSFLVFRNSLADFIRARGITVLRPETSLEQLLDIVFTTWFGRELDRGMINHTARLLLGEPIPPIRVPPLWSTRGQSLPGDTIHPSRAPNRRYIWRARHGSRTTRGDRDYAAGHGARRAAARLGII